MAAVNKYGTPSLSTPTPGFEHRLSGLIAGEDLGACDACYINSTDNKIYRSTGAAANAAAVVDGWTAKAYSAGEAVTIFWGVHFRYGQGLTPGSNFYLSGAVLGGLDTAASTGGTQVIARTIDDSRIFVTKSY